MNIEYVQQVSILSTNQMATDYPTSIDTLPNPGSGSVLDEPGLVHSVQHTNANDAIVALQTKLGIDLSAERHSVDYIVNLLLLSLTEHQSGGYKEITGFPFPEQITWYTNNGKTIKLIEKQFVYGSTRFLPEQIVLILFGGSNSNNVVRTITDTIVYNGVFEISRTRSVT